MPELQDAASCSALDPQDAWPRFRKINYFLQNKFSRHQASRMPSGCWTTLADGQDDVRMLAANHNAGSAARMMGRMLSGCCQDDGQDAAQDAPKMLPG